MKKLTIYQMAKKAGVSIATISRVVNPQTRYKVSPVTRAKIDALIEKYGYTPNVAAQNLSRASSRAIGVVVPQSEGLFFDPFYQKILSGVSDGLIGSGYQFKIVMLPTDKKWDLRNFKIGDGVDALVVPHWPQFFKNQSFIKKLKIPLALLSDWDSRWSCHRVSADHEKGGRLAAEFLMEKGVKKITVLTPVKPTGDSQLRLKGFEQQCKKHKIKIHQSETDPVELKKSPFFRLNESEIQTNGTVTCIDQPTYEMAKGAAQILLSDLGQRKKSKKRHYVEQIFPVRLIQKEKA